MSRKMMTGLGLAAACVVVLTWLFGLGVGLIAISAVAAAGVANSISGSQGTRRYISDLSRKLERRIATLAGRKRKQGPSQSHRRWVRLPLFVALGIVAGTIVFVILGWLIWATLCVFLVVFECILLQKVGWSVTRQDLVRMARRLDKQLDAGASGSGSRAVASAVDAEPDTGGTGNVADLRPESVLAPYLVSGDRSDPELDPELFTHHVSVEVVDDLISQVRDHHQGMLAAHEPLQGHETEQIAAHRQEALNRSLAHFDERVALGQGPLISIVLPTWNRARTLRSSIRSVLNQSYTQWELLVADDGSIDDTEHVVAAQAERDRRIRHLKLDHRGVSSARNAALAAARGAYVAFLDSDKEWDPEFLRSTTAVLVTERRRAVFATCEVTMGRDRRLMSVEPTEKSLRIGNSVDQTALVVERALLKEIGGFDESLKRAVDYDLIYRIADRTRLWHVPMIGVRYSEDDADPNRISEFESKTWNFHVGDQHAWRVYEGEEQPGLTRDLTSVIIDDVVRAEDAVSIIKGLSEAAAETRLEFLLIPRSSDPLLLARLNLLRQSSFSVRVVPVGLRGDRPSYINSAVRLARGQWTLLWEANLRWYGGKLSTLICELASSSVVHPVVLSATRLIRDAGIVYPGHGIDPVRFLARLPSDAVTHLGTLTVPSAPLPLLARTEDLCRVHGMTTMLGALWVDVDLAQKLAKALGRPVRTVPAAQVQAVGESRFVNGRAYPEDARVFGELWPVSPDGTLEAMSEARVHASFTGFKAASVDGDPDRRTGASWLPGVVARDRSRRLRWAIRTAAPASDMARSWGDYHYAQSLAEALRRQDQLVNVDYQDNMWRSTTGFEDVVLNLRGLREVPIPADATSLMWVISHPELVSPKELGLYDLVYAASHEWSGRVREQWGRQVFPLLQCTDQHRFYPKGDRAPEVESKILMVGNSRKQYRPAAWHAANAGLPVKIWGADWEDRVAPEYIAGQGLPNHELRRYYAGAAWVLNDHWPDMRDEGFISNRIFDVLASGGRLITDHVHGLEKTFGHRLATFQSPAELLSTLHQDAESLYPENVRQELAELVLREHTFDVRARRLVEDVLTHRARQPDS
ncbi:glycosyltransferase [Zhihengliuella flava]|uniref:Glycosyltransferase involved in cell wall biosynthesis n=1 Tax=Zhihengliuella flava TaxID=1285193 RepID=A0A931DB91_9MICC|nr:glycosyltransferase [Zhihengliuella flava]MBG6083550.1 glycosyltransferase involved in cell wall biosynthesis [Zhihengliuella flava]